MANIEKLLAMGLAQGADPTRMLLASTGCSGPERDRVTWEDVRHAVGTLPPEHRAILQLRAVPQLVTGSELAALVNVLALHLHCYEAERRHMAAIERAQDPGARAVLRAANRRQAAQIRVALCEYLDPRTCHRCRGAGKGLAHIPGEGVVQVTCDRCGGLGWKPWSDNRRAKAVGGDRNAWGERYAPGYDQVLRKLASEYRTASGAFKAVLFGGEDDKATFYGTIERRLQARV